MKLFSHSSTILPVADPQASAEYYRDVLGFSISFLWEDPPSYAVINRDDAVGIHFTKHENFKLSESTPAIYIFVHDPDALYEEYQRSGVKIVEPINDTEYKMREFVVEDINGYKLVLGKGI